MAEPDDHLAQLREVVQEAERDLWLLRNVELWEAEQHADQARRAYEHATRQTAHHASNALAEAEAEER
jgi:hypothetical protein